MRSQFTSLKTEPKGPVNNMGVPHSNQIIINNNNLTRYTTHPLTPGKAEQEGVLVQGEDKMEVDEEVSTFNYKFLGYVQLQEVASKACNCFVVVVVILRI